MLNRKIPANRGLRKIAQVARDEQKVKELNEQDVKHLNTLPDEASKMAYLKERVEKNNEEISLYEKQSGHNPLYIRLLKGRELFLKELSDKYHTVPRDSGDFPGDQPKDIVDWEFTKNTLKNDFLEKTKKAYYKEMEETGESDSDKTFTSHNFKNEKWGEYQKLQNENKTFNTHMPTLMSKITEKWTLKRRVKTYNQVFEELMEGYTSAQRAGIIERIAELEAYPELDRFLYEEIRKINAPKEKPNFQDNASASKETKEKAVKPMRWDGTAGELVYLHEQLRDNNFFPVSMDLQASIKNHYVDSEGKPFKSLKQTKQNYLNSKTGKPKRAGDIDSIVRSVKNSE